MLRLLHGATALLVPLAWLTGLLVYSKYDGRFGRLPFSLAGEWIDIHGTVGFLIWPVALLLALYALTAGRLRLRQPANALALVALMLAVGSGKLSRWPARWQAFSSGQETYQGIGLIRSAGLSR